VDIASPGGEVARNGRRELQAKAWKPVISSLNSKSEYQKDELFMIESHNNKDT
jgi:hypothetical protein